MTARGRRIRKRIGLSAIGVATAAVTAFLVWCSILYPATPAQFEAVTDDTALEVTENPAALVLEPAETPSNVGLLFVPGAKVPAEAYAYKLSALAESGVTVVISKPILNLAFFDYRSMATFTDLAPGVDSWYVGGHSLGGVKACQFASDPSVAGLVLFGSYCVDDLSGSDLPVLSIGGSEDGLSTPGDIADRRANLPADTEIVEIEGSSHAQFGNYGPQPGDGRPSITDDAVKSRIDELLLGFFGD